MTQSPRKTLFQFTVPLPPPTHTYRNEALTQQMLWPSYILHSTAAGRWKVQKFGGTNKIHILYFCFCSLIYISKKNRGGTFHQYSQFRRSCCGIITFTNCFLLAVFYCSYFWFPLLVLAMYVEKFKRMCVLLVD